MRADRNHALVASLAVVLVAAVLAPAAASDEIDLKLAAQYFGEAKKLCEDDGGRLWGKPLYGPLMFVEPKSRFVVANQQDADGKLEQRDGVFVGTLPKDETYANTAKEWSGTHWTMVVWPLPADEGARAELMTHELWHRIQNDLGLKPHGDVAQHLDECDGRFWIQLEWKALQKALMRRGEKRTEAIHDALIFRAYRRSLFKSAATAENALEIHEGLAEFTGAVLAHKERRDRLLAARAKLEEAPNRPSFVRSFAYASGPAYGLLLMDVNPGWCRKVKSTDDLGQMLANEAKILLPPDLGNAAMSRGGRYGGGMLYAIEEKRAKERARKQEGYRGLLANGPTLKIDLLEMNIQFDPNRVMSMEDAGNVYEGAKIIDTWGTLDAPGGLLLSSDRKRVTLSPPLKQRKDTYWGNGYTLTLKPGWKLEKIGKNGDCCLKKDE